ncbi:MAG: outer membrane protein assembly factor BamE [Pseudomonadota bacterium]
MGRTIYMKIKLAMASAALVVLTACASTYTSHGYVPSDTELQNVLVGVDTRETVQEVVGIPSSTGVLADGAWYYISSRIEYYAYRKPEIIERQIVAISFDKNDVVQNVERFGLKDGRVIQFSRRVTTASVAGTSFWRQLVNSIGNFTPGDFLEDS